MDDPGFLAWRAAKRYERRASKIRELQRKKMLHKIVLCKILRDEKKQKKRAFRLIKKSNLIFARFLKRRFMELGHRKIPLSIKIWSMEKLVTMNKLKYLEKPDPWKNASD